jgi:hypothetical protein
MQNDSRADLGGMALRIEQIERIALELKELGQGAPVIEKNIRSLLAAVYVLKFGITDVAESETTPG